MTTDGDTRSPLRMLSLRDVAERLGVSVATTRRLVRTQQLPAVRVGHQLRVRPGRSSGIRRGASPARRALGREGRRVTALARWLEAWACGRSSSSAFAPRWVGLSQCVFARRRAGLFGGCCSGLMAELVVAWQRLVLSVWAGGRMTVDELLGRLDRVKRTARAGSPAAPRTKTVTRRSRSPRATTGACCSSATPAARSRTIVAALGLRMADLFADTRTTPAATRCNSATATGKPAFLRGFGCCRGERSVRGGLLHRCNRIRRGCVRARLEAYAEAKGLPVDFLRSLGLSDAKYADTPAVRMPYVDR